MPLRTAAPSSPARPLRRLALPGLAGLALLLVQPGAVAINKCVGKNGKVAYQDEKCPGGTSETLVKPLLNPAPGAAAQDLGADDSSQDGTVLPLVSTQATYEGCAAISPGFDQRFGETYAAWRSSNAAALSRFEGTARYQQLMKNGSRQMRSMQAAGAQAQLVSFCESQFMPNLKKKLP
jgi:hypothetical protein